MQRCSMLLRLLRRPESHESRETEQLFRERLTAAAVVVAAAAVVSAAAAVVVAAAAADVAAEAAAVAAAPAWMVLKTL